MRPFHYARVESGQAAVQAHQAISFRTNEPVILAPAQYLAGGTNLIDLMRLDVMRPEVVTDINAIERTPSGKIEMGPQGLWLGALVRMSQTADHSDVKKNYPMIAQSLALAASPQIRNMASLGATCFNAHAVLTSAMAPTAPATNVTRALAARRWKVSTDGTRSSGPASIASRPMPAILPMP
jgi:CO/xanthine dehydrogenase FAD-binding subunit